MASQKWKIGFRLAVSLKRDEDEPEAAPTDKKEFFYAERDEEGEIRVQPLNEQDYPAGDPTVLDLEEFLAAYVPEPLYYFNRVKPAMQKVARNLAKGEKHLEDKRYAKAENDYRKVLAIDEENIRAIFGLGIACLALEKVDAGLAIFDKLMALDLAFGAEHKHLFNLFGIQMRKSGLFEQAVVYYQRGIVLNPEDEHLHFNASRSHFERQNMIGAYLSLAKALDLNPAFLEALMLQKALLKASGMTWAQLKLESMRMGQHKDVVGLDLDGAPWLEE